MTKKPTEPPFGAHLPAFPGKDADAIRSPRGSLQAAKPHLQATGKRPPSVNRRLTIPGGKGKGR